MRNKFCEFSTAIILVILYELLCYFFIVLKKPITGDEHHFYETIVIFSKNLTWGTILSYDELITPLTFIIYGWFAKTFGTDLHTVRIVSLIIGFFTHTFFFVLLKNILRQPFIYWGLFIIWLLNPYILGFNGLVFTDGLSNLLIVGFLFAVYKNHYMLAFLAASLLIYTRQYNILIVGAAGIYYLLLASKDKGLNLKMLLSLALGSATIIPLFIMWRGFSPVGAMSEKLTAVPFIFYAESLPVYIYCIFIFVLPISGFIIWHSKISKKEWYFIIIFTLFFYNLFPVAPSFIAVQDGFHTVGLFDKLVTLISGNNVVKHLLLYLSFLFGSVLFYLFVKEFFLRRYHLKSLDFQRFSLIYLIIFLAAMMVNFQIWEKYFTQVLPVVLIMSGKLLEQKLPQLSDNFKRLRRFKA